jgi:hypothetical protein
MDDIPIRRADPRPAEAPRDADGVGGAASRADERLDEDERQQGGREVAERHFPSPTRSSDLTGSADRGADDDGLAPADFYDLGDVPPEAEWFANLRNKNTRRAYQNDVRGFMRFAGLTRPQQFRRVNRALVR